MGMLSSLFGGGYEAPATPQLTAAPRAEATEPDTAAARDEERRKLRARKLMSGTILTSPLGVSGGGKGPGILGRTTAGVQ